MASPQPIPERACRALALCVLVLASGCDSETPEEPPPLEGVVLIVLDTLRADRASCYGNARPTTPNLDALAADGVLFERALAPSPWTLPSVGGLLSGLHPPQAFDAELGLRASLVERLRDAGVATAAVTEGGYVSRHFGMDRGFESYTEEEGAVQLLDGAQRPADPSLAETGLTRVFEGAKAWLRARDERPFFLFVHTYEPHTPYTSRRFAAGLDPGRIGPVFRIEHLAGIRSGRIVPTDAEKEYVTALYDGDIFDADAQVGGLLAELRRLGLEQRVAVIVTSDHGEELGAGYPSGLFDHGHSLRDGLLRTPLVVRDPRLAVKGERVREQVALIDVLPTVCELLDVPIEEPLPGRSLLPTMRGETRGHRVVFSGITKRGPQRVSISDGRHKLIRVTGAPPPDAAPLLRAVPEQQLYDLELDARETQNLAAERPELAAALGEALDRWLERVRVSDAAELESPAVEDQALLERLRSLGYTD